MEIVISPSNKYGEQYDTLIDGKQTISYGASGYSDFTKHKDPQRKDLYLARHSKEDWSKSNIASPDWMSRYIIWGKTTLKGAVDNVNKTIKMLNPF